MLPRLWTGKWDLLAYLDAAGEEGETAYSIAEAQAGSPEKASRFPAYVTSARMALLRLRRQGLAVRSVEGGRRRGAEGWSYRYRITERGRARLRYYHSGPMAQKGQITPCRRETHPDVAANWCAEARFGVAHNARAPSGRAIPETVWLDRLAGRRARAPRAYSLQMGQRGVDA